MHGWAQRSIVQHRGVCSMFITSTDRALTDGGASSNKMIGQLVALSFTNDLYIVCIVSIALVNPFLPRLIKKAVFLMCASCMYVLFCQSPTINIFAAVDLSKERVRASRRNPHYSGVSRGHLVS